MDEIPRIESVAMNGTVLIVTWRNGTSDQVDLVGWLARPTHPAFDILRDPNVLANPRVEDWGTCVAWDAEGDVAIDNVHLRLLIEQRRPFAGPDLAAWQKRMGLSNRESARLLNVGVSTLNAYKAGTSPIPTVVRIACRAMERDPLLFEAHYRPSAPAGRPRRRAA